MSDNVYITTSIAYVNDKPHIGFALETLQADVLARFYRQQGKKVFFLTGTDEHGSKIVQTAKAQDLTPRELADKNTARFVELTKLLNLSNDDFIRTSDKIRHWPSVVKMWNKLFANGDLAKDIYEGLYCVGCEAFLTEKELVDGKCPHHDRVPEKVKEENYFFKLGRYVEAILAKIESGEFEIVPRSRKNEIVNILKSGSSEVSFSRPKDKLSWGVPVPNDDSQVMYVWCDALTNYISALDYAEEGEKFERFWQDSYIVQIIGKDIQRFHAAIWPAMLMSAQLHLPNKLFIHGFITADGKKMSKSLGNVVDPFELVGKYGVDPVRYYLLKEIPSTGDGDFSAERFEEIYTSDLANGLGNLVSRITNMIDSYFGGQIKVESGQSNFNWLRIEEYTANLEYDKALNELQAIIDSTNKMIDDVKPWQLMKSNNTDDKEKVRELLIDVSGIISDIAVSLQPYLPDTAEKIKTIITVDKITKAEPLFPRLNEK